MALAGLLRAEALGMVKAGRSRGRERQDGSGGGGENWCWEILV